MDWDVYDINEVIDLKKEAKNLCKLDSNPTSWSESPLKERYEEEVPYDQISIEAPDQGN